MMLDVGKLLGITIFVAIGFCGHANTLSGREVCNYEAKRQRILKKIYEHQIG